MATFLSLPNDIRKNYLYNFLRVRELITLSQVNQEYRRQLTDDEYLRKRFKFAPLLLLLSMESFRGPVQENKKKLRRLPLFTWNFLSQFPLTRLICVEGERVGRYSFKFRVGEMCELMVIIYKEGGLYKIKFLIRWNSLTIIYYWNPNANPPTMDELLTIFARAGKITQENFDTDVSSLFHPLIKKYNYKYRTCSGKYGIELVDLRSDTVISFHTPYPKIAKKIITKYI